MTDLLTFHNAMQLYVFAFSMTAVWCIARTDRWNKWGYIAGLLSEPAWGYFAYTTRSWGIGLLVIWWSWSWGVGAWRRFRPATEKVLPELNLSST